MGNILIIKNNNADKNIKVNAMKSFVKKEPGYYIAMDGSLNEKHVIELKSEFGEEGLVLLLNYKNEETEIIEDIFIGSNAKINKDNNIDYCMKVHLTWEENKNAIKSIVDKIDLDIVKDFAPYCYVIMSKMESLYQELHERLIARDEVDVVNIEMSITSDEELYRLSHLAQHNIQACRIYRNSEAGRFRTEFQRDRERVVNCKAFRRLVDKAQIFSAEKGDYYRTRMTHSLEVNQIAKAIAYALNLNLDLTEAIALGHDLGHTPFGHQGERTLDEILSGKQKTGIKALDDLTSKRRFGGFKHNYQSARILTQLEDKYIDHPGLNVSVQVVEGVLKHTKIKPDEIELRDFLPKEYIEKIEINPAVEMQVCSTLEGQVVAIADEIAQRGHDVDDALTSGVMTIDEFQDRLKISKCSELEKMIEDELKKINDSTRLIVDTKDLKIARIVSCIVHYFIIKTIEHSQNNMDKYSSKEKITLKNKEKIIEFSSEVEKVNLYLEKVVQKKVICNSEVARADYNADMIVKELFKKYYTNPRLLHEGTIHKIFVETLRHKNIKVSNSAINLSDGSVKLVNKEIEEITLTPIDGKIDDEYFNTFDYKRTEKEIIIFEKRKILVRAIVDYIAGMTDGYALEEYEKLK